jgi:hypothetical protein
MESQSHPDVDGRRRGRKLVNDREIQDERPKVARDGALALRPRSWQVGSREQLPYDGPESRVSVTCPTDRVVGQCERQPVVPGNDKARERRLAEPDVVQLDETMIGREIRLEGGANLRQAASLLQEEIGALVPRGHAEGQWRREHESRPLHRSVIDRSEPGEGHIPGCVEIPLRVRGRGLAALERQSPALNPHWRITTRC